MPVMFGFAGLVTSIALIQTYPIWGFMLMLGLIILFMTRSGLELSSDGKSFRLFRSIFGLKYGKWQQIPFTVVSVLSKSYTESFYSRTNRSISDSNLKHEVYFLSSNHRNKQFICSFQNSNSAVEKAKEIASFCHLKTEKYNPKRISSRR